MKRGRKKSVDDVMKDFVRMRVKFTVKMLDHDEVPMVLVEGDSAAFESLGNLFMAHAKESDDDGFWFYPSGAGSAFFTKDSTLGLYLHRLPCTHAKGTRDKGHFENRNGERAVHKDGKPRKKFR